MFHCPTAMWKFYGSKTPLYSMIWGKRQIPVLSLWLPSMILQNFEFPHPFPLNLKKSREFPLPWGRESNPSPCIPQYIPLVGPGSYPWGKPMTCALGRKDITVLGHLLCSYQFHIALSTFS